MDRSTVQQQHGHSTHGTTSAHSTRAAAAAAAGSTLPTTHTHAHSNRTCTRFRDGSGDGWEMVCVFARFCCCNSASICLEWVSGRLRWGVLSHGNWTYDGVSCVLLRSCCFGAGTNARANTHGGQNTRISDAETSAGIREAPRSNRGFAKHSQNVKKRARDYPHPKPRARSSVSLRAPTGRFQRC